MPIQLTPDEQADAVGVLRELLRFDTTNPPGNERPAAEMLKRRLESAGLSATLLESAPGRANLVSRIDAGGHDPIVLSAHLDVVPHDRDKWTADPFGAEERDGWIYGRGAVDMKYVAAMNLMNFLWLARNKDKLRRDVIFLALADEELGCHYGARWMVDKHPDLLRARWGLNELGGFPVRLTNGKRVMLVQTAEKGNVWMRIRIPGTPGHGSIKHEDNPVPRAGLMVARLQNMPMPFRATDEARQWVEALAGHLGAAGVVVRMLANPLTHNLAIRLIPDAEQRRVFHAAFHDTANPTVIHGGSKTNVIPSEVVIEVDGRTLPGQTTEGFLDQMRAVVGQDVEIEVITEGQPYTVPARGELWDTIRQTVRESSGSLVDTIPFLMTGYTDSKYLGQLGIQMYGYAPVEFPDDVKFTSLVHGHDERIPRDGYLWGVAAQRALLERFCLRA